MAAVRLCEPSELYNLLNQRRGGVSRLAEVNYLYLIDARESQDYHTSHIITAKNVQMSSAGTLLLPEWVEVDSMQQVVVYDSSSSSVQDGGRAALCARVLEKMSLNPVLILRGGFQRFSAMYTFLRTEKILYTMTELENLKVYPVEVIPGLLYMGDLSQGRDGSVLRDLKVRAVVHISQSGAPESGFAHGTHAMLNIPLEDSVTSDLYSSFEKICCFIESNLDVGSRVLIVSRLGRSRCSAVAIAFLMHHFKYTLDEAWKSVLKCKPSMRPNSGFLQQLFNWELHIKGTNLTDISQPYF
ncbi:serine/threonine/tyrosine-interacting-like protein 1 [Salarias fasciatus]|uniref:serine/threonine/tyrosine-interacting-like protein 1 n=1 Tax=Salarias fasciatus TaxID=181472 RepID=UPI001176E419|nr:serine/threonine/tyrosine-interacting-like protein 1 [Salarias fasciatus]